MKRVLRQIVPIDDQPHEVPDGPVPLFARGPSSKSPGLERFLDVWVEVPTPDGWPLTDQTAGTVEVQIVGTGQPIPDDWTWLATTLDGRFVWHLYRLP